MSEGREGGKRGTEGGKRGTEGGKGGREGGRVGGWEEVYRMMWILGVQHVDVVLTSFIRELFS